MKCHSCEKIEIVGLQRSHNIKKKTNLNGISVSEMILGNLKLTPKSEKKNGFASLVNRRVSGHFVNGE